METFSVGLNKFMDEKGFDQNKIADICGVSYPLVNGWVKRRGLPTYDSLKALYMAGMDPVLMFGLDDKDKELLRSLFADRVYSVLLAGGFVDDGDPSSSYHFELNEINACLNDEKFSDDEKRLFISKKILQISNILNILSNSLELLKNSVPKK